MQKFMTSFFKSSLISSITLAILGGFLFFQSEFTIVTISYVIGGILIAIGALAIIRFINGLNNNEKKADLDIVYGIVTILFGIIVISNPKAIASIIPFVVGVIIIINSARKLQYGLELKKDNNNLWKATVIMSLITLLCGTLLIFNPFKGAEILTKVIGVLIFIYAILDMISTITINNTLVKIHNAIEEKNISEATVIEEKDEKASNNKKKK